MNTKLHNALKRLELAIDCRRPADTSDTQTFTAKTSHTNLLFGTCAAISMYTSYILLAMLHSVLFSYNITVDKYLDSGEIIRRRLDQFCRISRGS